MSDLTDEMLEFLKGRHYATLATLNEDNSIHLTTVWYLFEDGRFFFVTGSSARKARNCKARPEASVVVDSRRNQGDERSISVAGTVELLTGEKSKEINKKIIERYVTKAGIEDPNVGPVFEAAGETVICLTPQTWHSYDFRSVDDAYFGGILGREPNKWFLPID